MKKVIIMDIYQIRNVKNNKKYIGKSKNIYERFKNHKSRLNNNSYDNLFLQDDWNKYKECNFEFKILKKNY